MGSDKDINIRKHSYAILINNYNNIINMKVKLFDIEHSNVKCQNDMNVKRQTV